MGKLVRVLVVLCLLLSIGALVLGILLFNKRELLKGRAQKLETVVIKLGTLIEAEIPKDPGVQQYPERDLSPATLEFLDDQDFSSFWSNYSNSYETVDTATLNLKRREIELMTYYKRSGDGKVLKDARGLKVTTGEGTMQAVLDDLLAKAESQYNILTDTRQQLATTRSELVATIQDLEGEVARLQADLSQARDEIAQLQEEKRDLEDTVAEERRQVASLEDEKILLEDKIAQLEKELEIRDKVTGGTGTDAVSAQGTGEPIVVDPGDKGTVVAVNATWNFVILSLNEPALKELLGEDMDQAPPAVEYMIQREVEGEKVFVTKVKVQQVQRDKKLAIAQIMSDWSQSDVQEGDIVFN
jgi:DNA repair exonuclease SbcCD ATPase subunit